MGLTAAQHALRLTGVTASEIGAIVGAEGAYESSLAVWARKVGLVDVADETETPEHIELGNLLEPVIASLYARRTGFELYEPGTLVHPTDPLRIATPDRLVRGMARGAQIKKARTKGTWGREGTDDAPESIICQVQWECGVADLELEDVPVLFYGSHLAVYTIRRDEELLGGLIDLAHRWWRDHVVANVAPTPDGSERTKEALSKIYPQNRGKCVALGAPEYGSLAGQVFALAHEYTSARDGGKDVEDRKEAAGNALRLLIGDNDGFYAPWGRCTWKRPVGGRVDWKAVAEALGATPDLIARHTNEPSRTLSVHLKGQK
jgi:putative phage-type endonuclease